LLIALTLALHLPFVAQAFHLDDVQYLDVAQNAFRNPFFPLDLPSVFEGLHLTLWGHTHPPLNAYVIAGLLLLHDRSPSEIFLHSSFLVFPILVTVSFYFLARRFVRHALMVSVLLATNPTLMVCAHTLMADVPLLATWLCGIVLFVRGVDRNKNALVYAAALPITAACFYAYQGLAIIPLLAFYGLARKRLRLREVMVLFVPLLLMAGWQLSGYVHRGVIYASTMFGYMEVRGFWQGTTKVRMAVASLTYLGGTILPFPFIFWRMGLRWKGVLTWVGLAVGIAVAHQKLAGYTLLEQAFFVGCFGGGVAAVIWIVIRGLESWSVKNWAADDIFLCLWFVGVLAGCVAAFFSGSARYLLPACPPLLLLLVRADEQRIIPFNRVRVFYAALLAGQLLLGFSLAQSDYEFAATGRREAHEFESEYLGKRQTFLFSGEWGFRYYLTAMGGEIMAEDTTGSPGELVVKSRLCLGRAFDNELHRSLELLEQRAYRIRSPLRVLDQHSHAGFWSDGWGVLPFWFSRETLDELSIYRVKGN
jgi:hypothetical protein